MLWLWNPKLTFGAGDRTTLGCSPIKLRMYTRTMFKEIQSIFFPSRSLVSSLCRLPRLWWISITARSPFIRLISLLLYCNWQYFHTIMVRLLTGRSLSKQEWQKMCESYWLLANFGWQNWRRIAVPGLMAVAWSPLVRGWPIYMLHRNEPDSGETWGY